MTDSSLRRVFQFLKPYKNVPKQWFQYILQMSSLSIQQCWKKEAFIPRTQCLPILARQITLINRMEKRTQIGGRRLRQVQKSPLGSLLVHHIFEGKPRTPDTRLRFRVKWQSFFSLDRRLGLRIFFQHIKFSTPADHCQWGQVSVNQTKHHPQQPQSGSAAEFRYCGQHQQFSLFLGNNIFISLTADFTIPLSVKLNYSVADFGVVESMHSTNTESFSSTVTLFKVHQQKPQALKTELITVRSTQQIILSVRQNTYRMLHVHDGPGFRSPVLFSQDRLFLTSGFHCFLQVLSDDIAVLPQIIYQGKLRNFKLLHIMHQHKMFLHFGGKTNLDGYRSEARDEFQINFTITSLKHEGFPSFSCKYAGLEFVQENPQSTFTLCDSVISPHGHSRSILSSSSSMILIFYCYPPYARVSAKLTVSVTQCKSIQISSCHMNAMCEIQKHRLLCERHPLGSMYSHPKVLFKIDADECLFFHVTSEPSKHRFGSLPGYAPSCYVLLSPDKTSKDLELEYTLAGSFQEFNMNKKQERHTRTQGRVMYEGTSSSVCLKESSHCECNLGQSRSFSIFNERLQKLGASVIVMKTSYFGPLQISLGRFSRSWLSVKIRSKFVKRAQIREIISTGTTELKYIDKTVGSVLSLTGDEKVCNAKELVVHLTSVLREIIVSWSSRVLLAGKVHKFVSVQGVVERGQFRTEPSQTQECSLSAWWPQGNYQNNFLDTGNSRGRSSHNTSFHNGKTGRTIFVLGDFLVRRLLSSHDSSRICERFGAQLPEILDKQDEKDFLAFVKMEPALPPIEAIFIGLVSSQVIHVQILTCLL